MYNVSRVWGGPQKPPKLAKLVLGRGTNTSLTGPPPQYKFNKLGEGLDQKIGKRVSKTRFQSIFDWGVPIQV